MSLPDFSTQSALFSTVPWQAQFFGPGNRFRIFAEKIYPLVVEARPKLIEAYCPDNGRPAIEPALLAGTTLLQFLEGVTDREAVELLAYHSGWHFALNRPLGVKVFHPTVLVTFRQRLIEHEQSPLIFAAILEGLVVAGLVERNSKQRLDSTQMMGLLSRMNRLECVRETLALALKELEETAAHFGQPSFWTQLWERYVQSKLDYRTEASVLKTKMDQTGADAWRLLQWIAQLSDPQVGQGQQVQLLQRVFAENFECDDDQTLLQREAQPPGAVHNPYEPQAQWAAKGQGKQKKEHVGYKVQVAETVKDEVQLQPGEPTQNFITAIVTQDAIGSDEAGQELVEQEQAFMGLEKAPVLYVDGAYVSAQKLAQAQSEGRQIIGPAQPAPKKEGKFSVEDFQIKVEERQAICPAGKVNTQCSRLAEEATGKVSYRFEFSTHCQDCPLRGQCVGENQKHRTILVGEHHSHLQERRREQKTEAFQQKGKNRNAIEGTQSELVRAHGLRRARYRGKAKVRLQNYFIGAACNAKRWSKRVIWEAKQARESAKLSPMTC
jgi:transposase